MMDDDQACTPNPGAAQASDRLPETERGAATVAEDGVVVGVDIGGTKTALMVMDLDGGAPLAMDRFPTPAEAGPDRFIADLLGAIRALVRQAGRPAEMVRAVGLAVPGPVVAEAGRVVAAGNLRGWQDVPLRDRVARELGVPVFVEQDANAAALGERWQGGARQMNNFVFLALGTGLGAGVIINGRLHRGFHNAAGEIGRFVLAREALGQDRDGHGHGEVVLGARAIRAAAQQATGGDLSASAALGRGDDPALAPLVAAIQDDLAMVVIAIAALLDPEAIIFGGGTATADDRFFAGLRERVTRELTAVPALMPAVLGEDAQLYGAVFGALWSLDPALAPREELR